MNSQSCTRGECDCARETLPPEIAIFETPENYIVEAELPGVSKENVDVTLEGGELILAGRRTITAGSGTVILQESAEADFRRTITLNDGIDVEHVSARMADGVLTVTLPKNEKARPRAVAIES